jgi:hypothetical protein
MGIAQEFCEMVRQTYSPIFPTSRKKRKAFLERVRGKVEYYRPKIEQRSGVGLGKVEVKDNRHWLSDVTIGYAYDSAINYAWEHGRIPTEKDFQESFVAASIHEAILFCPIGLFNVMRGADFRQHNGVIYVPFNYMNRFLDMDFRKRIRFLDYGVVHELSHVLWERISGEKDGYWPESEGRKWFEGFATYCADNFFADFYPDGAEKMTNLPSDYTAGKQRIEKLIAEHGNNALLELPCRWREFSGHFG